MIKLLLFITSIIFIFAFYFHLTFIKRKKVRTIQILLILTFLFSILFVIYPKQEPIISTTVQIKSSRQRLKKIFDNFEESIKDEMLKTPRNTAEHRRLENDLNNIKKEREHLLPTLNDKD